MKRSMVATLCAAALPALAAQQPAPNPSPTPLPKRIEARAEQELKKMSEFLAKQKLFALEAEETFDEVPDGEPKTELTNLRRVAVQRPNQAAADATGDTLNRASWYDGKNLTILDKETNVYATVAMPPTIDAMIDTLEDEYGVVLPLADLIAADPYKVLSQGITYGRYLGIHQAAGVPCHHLVFAQETIEWQIWIDAGDQPLPRKLVINYVHEPGEPQYSATIKRWSLDPKLPDGLFTFEAPEGATKVDAAAMRSEKPRPGGTSEGGR